MGIALAFGAIIGTQAIREPQLLLIVLASLGIVSLATTEAPRNIILLLAIGLVMGAGAGHMRTLDAQPALARAPRVIESRIVSDPKTDRRGSYAYIDWHDAGGIERHSMALFPAVPEIGRGDIVEASIISQGTYGELLFVQQHRIVEQPRGLQRLRRLFRQYMTSATSHRIGGSPGTLTLGLLIGDDSALPGDERTALRRSGLSHITAVSGWNVTLVTGSIGAVFLAFGLRGWFWMSVQLSMMSAYVWIVGLDPPVTRAAIMAIVALTAARLGRPAHSITALCLASALMVMHAPEIVSSLSFQLSVMATFALIAAMRLTAHRSGWKGALATSTLASAMTGLATAPVLAATLGTLSLATVPANIVAGPLIPVASIGGVLVVALETIPPLAAVVGWGVWGLTSLILVIARGSAAVPLVFFEFEPLSGSASAIVHVLLLAGIAAVTPEGRLIRRRLLQWVEHEPRAAVAAGAGMSATMIAALIVT